MVTKLKAQLDLEYRKREEKILYMRDVQKLSFGEIATLMGMTKARVWQIYRKVRDTNQSAQG